MLPLDGVYLAMYGAMYVDGMEDAEGDYIGSTRELVGKECLITASFDLHGSLFFAVDMRRRAKRREHVEVIDDAPRTSTVYEPAKHLWAQLPAINAEPDVMDASLIVGYRRRLPA